MLVAYLIRALIACTVGWQIQIDQSWILKIIDAIALCICLKQDFILL